MFAVNRCPNVPLEVGTKRNYFAAVNLQKKKKKKKKEIKKKEDH